MDNFNLENKKSKIDFSKLSSITNQLKRNLSKKFNNIETLNNEISKDTTTNNVSTLSGLVEFVDPITQFFQDGIYDGNLKINGILSTKNKNKNKNNNSNELLTKFLNRNSSDNKNNNNNKNNNINNFNNISITGGIIENATIANLRLNGPIIGLEDFLFNDYTPMYSIETRRTDFDIFVKNSNNSVNISYLNKNNYYYQTSFGKVDTVFTAGGCGCGGDRPISSNWIRMSILDSPILTRLGEVRRIGPVWVRDYENNYINSELTHVLFKPKNGYDLGYSKFKIENMEFHVTKNAEFNGTVKIDEQIYNYGGLYVNTQRGLNVNVKNELTLFLNSSFDNNRKFLMIANNDVILLNGLRSTDYYSGQKLIQINSTNIDENSEGYVLDTVFNSSSVYVQVIKNTFNTINSISIEKGNSATIPINSSAGYAGIPTSINHLNADIDASADGRISLISERIGEDSDLGLANNILLRTSGGDNEQILIHSEKGVKSGSNLKPSIKILSDKGGINLESNIDTPDAIVINSTKGGIDILADDSSPGQDIDIYNNGGSINLTATENNTFWDEAEAGIHGYGSINLNAPEGSIDIYARKGVYWKADQHINNAIDLTALIGGIDLNALGSIPDLDIDLFSNTSINLIANEDISDAITINATKGGIDIFSLGDTDNDDIDIKSSTSINLIANENISDAITLNATGGGIDIFAYGSNNGNITTITISGEITDALNPNIKLSNMTINITDKNNNIKKSTTTNQLGQYSFNIPKGYHLFKSILNGYCGLNNIINVDENNYLFNFSMTQTIEPGNIRLILNWNATPTDLDSHMKTEISGVEKHIYYGNTNDGGITLDVDDTDGYGPETMTINSDSNGLKYAYYIFNYDSSNSLVNCGASVQIYDSNCNNISININEASGSSGNYWHVCNFNIHKNVEIVNEIVESEPILPNNMNNNYHTLSVIFQNKLNNISLASFNLSPDDINIMAITSIAITANENISDAITLNATNGGIDIFALGDTDNDDIDIKSSTSINLNALESNHDAITMIADNGGIDIFAQGIITDSIIMVTITGVISDALNPSIKLSNTTINIVDQNSEIKVTATTDDLGNYSLNIPTGKHLIQSLTNVNDSSSNLRFDSTNDFTQIIQLNKIVKIKGIKFSVYDGASANGPKTLKLYYADNLGNYPESNLILDISNIAHSDTHIGVNKIYNYNTNSNPLTNSLKLVVSQQAIPTDPGYAYIWDYSNIYSEYCGLNNIINVSETNNSFNFALTRILEDGDIRLILNWLATPTDLDSHIKATINGSEKHINYMNVDDSNIKLDVDDTDGYGPETMTIKKNCIGTKFIYYIYNYDSSNSLKNCGANAQIYDSNCNKISININEASGESGLYWYICNIDQDRNVEIINEIMQTEPSISNIISNNNYLSILQLFQNKLSNTTFALFNPLKAHDLNLKSNTSIKLEANEDISDAITINATKGGIDIFSFGDSSGDNIDIKSSTSINIEANENAPDAITLTTTNGGIDIFSYGVSDNSDINIFSTLSINLEASKSSSNAISLTSTNGGILLDSFGSSNDDKIKLYSMMSTEIIANESISNAISLNAPNGGIEILSLGEGIEDKLYLRSNSKLSIESNDETKDAISITSKNGGIDILSNGSSSVSDINILSSESLNIEANETISDAITINATNGGIMINSFGTNENDNIYMYTAKSAKIYANDKVEITANNDDIMIDSYNEINFKTSSNERLLIKSDGKIGINNNSPTVTLDINMSDAIKLPNGTTAERPIANSNDHKGYIRYNSTLDQFEGYGPDNSWSPFLNEIIIDTKINNLVANAPDALNTLNELASALSNDANFASTITTLLSEKQPLINSNNLIDASYISTGVISNTEFDYLNGLSSNIQTQLDSKLSSGQSIEGTSIGLDNNNFSVDSSGNTIIKGTLTVGQNSMSINSGLITDTSGLISFDDEILSTNGKIGIGLDNPDVSIHINNTDAIMLPKGTTIERPTANSVAHKGYIRYNTTLDQFEGFGSNNSWISLSGGGGGGGGGGGSVTFGINDGNGVQIDSTSINQFDYAKFTDSGLEGKSIDEVKIDLSVNNLDNRELKLYEDAINGTNYVSIKTQDDLNSSYSLILPSDPPTNNKILKSDSNGNLSWTSVLDAQINDLNDAVFYDTSTGDFAGTLIIGSTNVGNDGTYAKYNSGFGKDVLDSLTTGARNLAMGYLSLSKITASNDNTSIGAFSMENTSGIGTANCSIGSYSLNSNTSGSYNISNGYKSMFKNTTGGYNISIGIETLFNNTTGFYNTAIGYKSLYTNSGGAFNTTSSNSNVAIGYKALFSNFSGGSNTSIGTNSMFRTTTGSNNIGIGESSGYNNTAGYNNVFIGYNSDTNSGTISNSISLGNAALVSSSNSIQLGNSNISSLKCQVSLTVSSDRRIKKNIKNEILGLEFINSLNPVSYNKINPSKYPIEIRDPRYDNKLLKESEDDKNNYIGLIAQEVEQSLKSCNRNIDDIVDKDEINGQYSIKYTSLIMPLINSIKELNNRLILVEQKNKLLEKNYKMQQKKIDDLKKKLKKT